MATRDVQFMDMPQEIRQIIYSHHFATTEPYPIRLCEGYLTADGLRPSRTRSWWKVKRMLSTPAIFLVSQQIYAESRPIRHASTPVILKTSSDILSELLNGSRASKSWDDFATMCRAYIKNIFAHHHILLVIDPGQHEPTRKHVLRLGQVLQELDRRKIVASSSLRVVFEEYSLQHWLHCLPSRPMLRQGKHGKQLEAWETLLRLITRDRFAFKNARFALCNDHGASAPHKHRWTDQVAFVERLKKKSYYKEHVFNLDEVRREAHASCQWGQGTMQ